MNQKPPLKTLGYNNKCASIWAGCTRQDRKNCIHFPTASSYMVINYHQLECKVTSLHSHCDHHGNLCMWDVEENGHDRSQVKCLSSSLPACNPRHLVERPCHKRRGDEEGRRGATPRHCYNKEKKNGWPRSQTAERKTSPYSYWVPEDGRKRGRPKKTWRSTFKEDLGEMGVSWHGARRIASDRDGWRHLVARCSERNRRTYV